MVQRFQKSIDWMIQNTVQDKDTRVTLLFMLLVTDNEGADQVNPSSALASSSC